ncbi:MAG: NHL repeat-containing protein [Planctomycetota bacterium]|jgi:sugar lactone lactonase YvrE
MRPIALLTSLCLLAGCSIAGESGPADPAAAKAAPPKFVAGPTAKKDGDGVKISFELDRETDVAVFVVDAKGHSVRHLAAGLLGAKAPAPLAKDSLKQELVWDGKDDAGKKAEGGPFRVRVAAGIGVEFAGTSFGSEDKPDDLTNVIGLAPRPGGGVYVLSQRWRRAWWTHTSVHAFTADGKYEKTIKPFPSTIDAEKVKKLTPFATEDGKPMPVIYRVLSISYYPFEDVPQQMAVDAEGNLHLTVIRAAYRKDAGKYIATIDAEGGVPLETYVGKELLPEISPGDPHLAVSGKGEALFATGLDRGPGKSSKTRPNTPIVWKIELPARSEVKKFFGDHKEVGSGETGLSDPRGVAVDGKGKLYVADRGNNRVVILDESSGKYLGAFELKGAIWVAASRKTGAVYAAGPDHLAKFVVGKDGKAAEKARVKLPAVADRYRGRAKRSFALDDSGERPVLWAGLSAGGTALSRCQEKEDGSFTDLEQAGYRPARTYWNLFGGLDRRTIGCKAGNSTVRILDEDTGKTRDLRLTGSGGQTYRLGPDGQIYGMDHWKWGIRRWDKDGKFMPFEDSKNDKEFKGRLWNNPTGTTSWERDFDVDRHGNVYTKQRGRKYHGRMMVDKYTADGKRAGRLIWVVSDGCHGPRVDAAGNVYITESIRPPGVQVPEYFKDKLPKTKINKRGSPLQQYRWMYGSVIKFSPKGGAVWFPIINKENDIYGFEGEAELPEGLKKVKIDTGQGDRVAVAPGELEGAEWYHYGVSYILDMHPGHNRRCHCTATEFEVDDFGRSFYTDQGRFRVVILDTAGNELLAFGQYGNQDACGEIAFSWFVGLGITDRYVYVADGSNRRVLRIKKVYGADTAVDIQ